MGLDRIAYPAPKEHKNYTHITSLSLSTRASHTYSWRPYPNSLATVIVRQNPPPPLQPKSASRFCVRFRKVYFEEERLMHAVLAQTADAES
jgi:hypothetical protein